MPRNILLEIGGGGSNNQEYVRKRRGVSIKRMCAYEGGGGQILANLERTY